MKQQLDLKNGNLKQIFFKYLFAGVFGALVVSIYSLVDMVCVGQYEGPNGSAALSVVLPCFSFTLSFGTLVGIGGSVIASVAEGRGDRAERNRVFTSAIIISCIVGVVLTVFLIVFEEQVLRLFGADDNIIGYAMKYMKWVAWASPAFLIGPVLQAFVRNDNAPLVATISVLAGGIFNTVGDVCLVFLVPMGIEGAGLATMVGQYIAVAVLVGYFLSKKCTFKMVKPTGFWKTICKIAKTGAAPFVIDVSLGVLVVLFNNQTVKLFGNTELAVFGAIANVTILFQSLYYGVGQSIQPIVSENYGAGNDKRVQKVLYMGVGAVAVMSVLFVALSEAIPEQIIRLFMSVDDGSVLDVGIPMVRVFAATYVFMGYNIVASYYLQSVVKSGYSFVISICRGLLFCTVAIYAFPAIFGKDALWWAMAFGETVTAVISTALLIANRKKSGTLDRLMHESVYFEEENAHNNKIQ